MTVPAYVFDKTRQRSTLDRTSDISTDVDAVVIGTCSPALLFGLKTLVDTTPDLRFVGSANTLHDFIETCVRAPAAVSRSLLRTYFELRGLQERRRVAYASLETQRAVLDLVELHECMLRGMARCRSLLLYASAGTSR